MKTNYRNYLAKLFLVAMSFISSGTMSAQTFEKGSVVLSAQGIGGLMDTPDDYKLGYGGRLSVEFGIADNLFNGKGAIGIGLVASDLYGGTYESLNSGEYNYQYTITTYIKEKSSKSSREVIRSSTHQERRHSTGAAECDVNRNDATLMATISLHAEFAEHLDTYLMVGGGATYCTRSFSNYRNAVNLKSVDHIEKKPSVSNYTGPVISYSFNDFNHVKWAGFDPKFYPAAMGIIGARYYFTDHLALNAELGMSTFTIKKNLNAMTLGGVGVSFKF